MRADKLFAYLLITSACLISFAGCSGRADWMAKTYPAKGHILINGEAPAGLVVVLNFIDTSPDKRLSKPQGLVGQDGLYQLSTYGIHDGCPVGKYAVTLDWPAGERDRLEGQFDSIEEAVATVTIERGDNVIPNIELTGVRIGKGSTAEGGTDSILPEHAEAYQRFMQEKQEGS